MKIGITGGIGSGKSYVCRLLSRRGIQVYDCDAAAKRLMQTSSHVRQQLTTLLGPAAYDESHHLNKAVVARFLLASEANAKAVDTIVHPAVFDDFRHSGFQWLESAILYESGADQLVDRVIVVTAPESLRVDRVMRRDGITREQVLAWMARQWPQDEVRRHADYEIINDGTTDLEQQINNIIQLCNTLF